MNEKFVLPASHSAISHHHMVMVLMRVMMLPRSKIHSAY